MGAQGVDVLAVIRSDADDAHNYRLSKRLPSAEDLVMQRQHQSMEARAAVAELVEAAETLRVHRAHFLCGKPEYNADWINLRAALLPFQSEAE